MSQPISFKKLFASVLTHPVIVFVTLFVLVFAITYSILLYVGLVPQAFSLQRDTPSLVDRLEGLKEGESGLFGVPAGYENIVQENNSALPTKIRIPAVGVDGPIENPSSVSVSVLDQALQKGAVRYPGSGTPAVGNMLLFGHSTSFSVVNNNAYKVFNGLSKLNAGDEIFVEVGDKEYVYSVVKVRLVDSRDTLVEFGNTRHMLTLSTCNSFGEATDRYVVEADFVRES